MITNSGAWAVRCGDLFFAEPWRLGDADNFLGIMHWIVAPSVQAEGEQMLIPHRASFQLAGIRF
jgi:hypothetical protein